MANARTRVTPGRLVLLAASTLLSLYALQLLLLAYSAHANRGVDLPGYARSLGLDYDDRSPSQAVKDLRASGRDVWLHAAPTFIVPDGLSDRGRPLFPLAGLSRKEVIFCNEQGRYLTYRTDEHGFNNPSGLYRPGRVDVAVIGDSYAEGVCVERGQDIASRLRERHPSTVNLGELGSGPLIELGILREYAARLRPRAVFWIYFGNDLGNLLAERRSPILTSYLSPRFSQRLFGRQPAVDAAWRRYLATHAGYEERRSAETQLGEQQEAPKRRALRFFALYYLKTFIRDVYPLSDHEQVELPLACRIIDRARRETEAWGGRFYFVYLPGWIFFKEKRRADRAYGPLVAWARSQGIATIDVYDTFSKLPDPLSFFYLRQSTHYNARGYAIVADLFERALRGQLGSRR